MSTKSSIQLSVWGQGLGHTQVHRQGRVLKEAGLEGEGARGGGGAPQAQDDLGQVHVPRVNGFNYYAKANNSVWPYIYRTTSITQSSLAF